MHDLLELFDMRDEREKDVQFSLSSHEQTLPSCLYRKVLGRFSNILLE